MCDHHVGHLDDSNVIPLTVLHWWLHLDALLLNTHRNTVSMVLASYCPPAVALQCGVSHPCSYCNTIGHLGERGGSLTLRRAGCQRRGGAKRTGQSGHGARHCWWRCQLVSVTLCCWVIQAVGWSKALWETQRRVQKLYWTLTEMSKSLKCNLWSWDRISKAVTIITSRFKLLADNVTDPGPADL